MHPFLHCLLIVALLGGSLQPARAAAFPTRQAPEAMETQEEAPSPYQLKLALELDDVQAKSGLARLSWEVANWKADAGLTLVLALPEGLAPARPGTLQHGAETGRRTLPLKYAQGSLDLRLEDGARLPLEARGELRQKDALVDSYLAILEGAPTADSLPRVGTGGGKVSGLVTGQLAQEYTVNLEYGFSQATGDLASLTDHLNSANSVSYGYGDINHKHAVTETDPAHAGGEYSYDANGNMLLRYENGIEYSQTWNAENRLKKVTWTISSVSHEVSFTYDGDGTRVMRVVKQGEVIISQTITIGGTYEKELVSGVVTKYYSIGGKSVAMRQDGVLTYLLSDHLGSNAMAFAVNGVVTAARYLPYGQPRVLPDGGLLATDKAFTGQRAEAFGLMDFNARYYSPRLGRFISADSIIPQPDNPIAWDRYAGFFNNPLNYNDPSGHHPEKYLFYDADVGKDGLSPYLVTPDRLKTVIQERFGIEMVDGGVKWGLNNLLTAHHALFTVNTKLNGFLKSMASGTTFTLTGEGNQYWGQTISTGVTYHVLNGNTKIPLINFLHETGHLLNSVPALDNAFSGQIMGTPDWVKDGYVDRDILLDMFYEPVQAIPMNEPNDPWEYWADAFANYVAGNIDLSKRRGQDMAKFVNGALGPYINR